jgi:uncharacterized protein involved in exopolysaccharide biosynthesis
MLGRQTAAAPVERIAPPDRDSWENPAIPPAAANANELSIRRTLSPWQIIATLWSNLRRILLLALGLFLIGALLLVIFPGKYVATSLVIIDPREQKITNDQDVLPGIGQDAAALQSIVEIAKSDGFLRPLIEKLNVAADTEISGGETNMSRLLTRFRSRLDVSRRGLTYVIAFSFSSSDATRSAYYANAIAEAFVAEQTKARATATEEAAGWLNNRLKDLRDKLTASENSIAAFKSKYKIIEAGKDSTTRQVRATELSQQMSVAKLRTEEAKSRYDQVQRDLRANVETSAGSRSELLASLRASRSLLNDQIAQKRAVLGDRHPDVVISLTQSEALERQIDAERRRIIQAAKSDYEAQREQQKQVEGLLNEAERDMLTTSEAAVKLQDLQREADANRSIYEQFLGRYKTTSEQRSLQSQQTKVVSVATVPARTSRPSLTLLLVATAMAALLGSASVVTIAEVSGMRWPTQLPKTTAVAPVAREPVLESAPALAPEDPTIKATLDLPVWGVMPFASLAGGATAPSPDVKRRLADCLETIALTRGLRGRVVLFLSGSPLHGRSVIAEALSTLALDRGMLSVLIQIEPEKFGTVADISRTQMQPQAVVRTSSPSLQTLLSNQQASPAGDFRSEFDIIVVDGTALPDPAEIAGLTGHIDFAIFLIDAKQDGAHMTRAMDVLSSNRHIAKGVIVDQALAAA